MKSSILSKFAAVLVVSALAPLPAFAQTTTAPAPTTPAAAAQPNMRKITSNYMLGKRTARNANMHYRQTHRATTNGRYHFGHRRTWGTTRTATGAMPVAHASKNATAPTGSGSKSAKPVKNMHKAPAARPTGTTT